MKKFLIIAGEPSGDARGAELVSALRLQDPFCFLYGAGGPKMKEAGVRVDYDLAWRAFVGFTDVVKHYPFIKKTFDSLLRSIEDEHPDGIILIDYPGFNLWFAKAVKLHRTPYTVHRTPIFYYISPQIWAWGAKRIELIKRVVDQMIVVFSFEETLYRKAGVPVAFVGHPFLDTVKPDLSAQETFRSFGLSPEKTTIALLPGSRLGEVKRHLPVMLEAAGILSKEFPNLQFVIAKPETLPESIYDDIVGAAPRTCPFRIVTSHLYDLLHIADAAAVSSGSATLEAALMNVPMAVIYKTNWLNYLLGKMMVKIPHIALVNVVAGKKIVPELIQRQATGPAIAKTLRPMIGPVETADYIREELSNIRRKLGSPGASRRAAETILREMTTAEAGIL